MRSLATSKKKKCKHCKTLFNPERTFQPACSIPCAIALVNTKKNQEYDRKTRQMKRNAMSRSDYVKAAQKNCNAYIRYRDKNEPCISCGSYGKGQYHAGHFQSTAASPELRFHPFNIAKQCAQCNLNLSGNLIYYRANLVKKVGRKMVEWLEGPHTQYKVTIDDLIDINTHYKNQLKYLKSIE